ncbi:MAG TPA: Ppx/GppA phosphatase family protein [Acidimicrobiia bacterium]|nr:Ppx/GppA phosphatase family protein [Acidimicrobiia bacterium]
MSRVGAVDIGTNSVRLLVAEIAEGAGPAAPLTTLDRRMTITRLGAGVDATRVLAPDAIDRTVAVLREYREALDASGITTVRATATSAARDAQNRDAFFAAATDALGVTPELLSGAEEARLSFLGATAGLDAPAPYLVVDIGGGSTELVVGTERPEHVASIDMGCVRVTEQWLASDPPSPEELSNAVSAARDELADTFRAVPGLREAQTVLGLAGTVTTVAAIEQGLAAYDRDRIHHFRLTRAAAEDIFRTLALEPIAERRHNPGLDPGRVDVIVGGVVVLVSLFRVLDLEEMLVSEADILDGLARSIA